VFTAPFVLSTQSIYVFLYPRRCVFTARYDLPKLCIFSGYENKQRLFHSAALIDCFYNTGAVCSLRGMFCPQSGCFYKRGGVFTARYTLPKQCIYEPLFHCRTLSDWFL
jgi:hypothetical protein